MSSQRTIMQSDEKLLTATRDSVILHGVRRTTANDIAERAGVSRMTFYRRMGSVENAVLQTLTREFRSHAATLRTGTPEGTGREQLVHFAVESVRVFATSPLLASIGERDPEFLIPYVTDRFGSSQQLILDQIGSLIELGTADGSIEAGRRHRDHAAAGAAGRGPVLEGPAETRHLRGSPWPNCGRCLNGTSPPGAHHDGRRTDPQARHSKHGQDLDQRRNPPARAGARGRATPWTWRWWAAASPGPGVALDAVSRGLSVALIESNDFGSGTSGYSSKLVHGGLRYLTKADFPVAWESAVERRWLMQSIAPHLVHPLGFIIPDAKDSPAHEAMVAGAGVVLYDLLRRASGLRSTTLPRPQLLSSQAVSAMVPALEAKSLRRGLLYWDGQVFDDARLVLGVLRTAAGLGAHVMRDVKATALDATSVDGDRHADRRARADHGAGRGERHRRLGRRLRRQPRADPQPRHPPGGALRAAGQPPCRAHRPGPGALSAGT